MLRLIISVIRKKVLNAKVKREGGQAYSISLRNHFIQKYDIHVGYGSYGCFITNGDVERGK